MHTEICRDFQDGKGGIGTVSPLWAYPKCLSGPTFFMEMLTGERGEEITPKQEPECGITAWLWDKAPAGLALCLRRQVSVALLGFSKQPFALLGQREKAEPTLQQKPTQTTKKSLPRAPAPSLLAGPPHLPHSMHGAGAAPASSAPCCRAARPSGGAAVPCHWPANGQSFVFLLLGEVL